MYYKLCFFLKKKIIIQNLFFIIEFNNLSKTSDVFKQNIYLFMLSIAISISLNKSTSY